MKLSRELWDALAGPMQLGPDESYERAAPQLRRGLRPGGAQSRSLAAKYVGGVRTLRDRAGSRRAPLHARSGRRAARGAEARRHDGLFTVDSFRFKPEFLRRLGARPVRRGTAAT